MAIYRIDYINESDNSSSEKMMINKYKNQIKTETNKICKQVYDELSEKYKKEIKTCPQFSSVELIDGYYWIMLSGLNDTYATGLGLDFERYVSNKLNKSKLSSYFKFMTEDYPGILITLK